jgi:hypothetical protein
MSRESSRAIDRITARTFSGLDSDTAPDSDTVGRLWGEDSESVIFAGRFSVSGIGVVLGNLTSEIFYVLSVASQTARNGSRQGGQVLCVPIMSAGVVDLDFVFFVDDDFKTYHGEESFSVSNSNSINSQTSWSALNSPQAYPLP